MRTLPLIIVCLASAACAVTPPSDRDIAAASHVNLCTGAGRAYALNDAQSYSRITTEIARRAAGAAEWVGNESCLTYAQMGLRQIVADAQRREQLAAAMRQVGQQLQMPAQPVPGITCTSQSFAGTTTTRCD